MPRVKIAIYQDEDRVAPMLDWLDSLQSRARAKCLVRIERLGEMGHELRRPEADFLRDGIYELRVSLSGVHYRVLYFFHGQTAVVLSHGVIKQDRVPPREIDRAIERKHKFLADPEQHTYREP